MNASLLIEPKVVSFPLFRRVSKLDLEVPEELWDEFVHLSQGDLKVVSQ
jgi:hypothetical protein